jgi:hypothetical protein
MYFFFLLAYCNSGEEGGDCGGMIEKGLFFCWRVACTALLSLLFWTVAVLVQIHAHIMLLDLSLFIDFLSATTYPEFFLFFSFLMFAFLVGERREKTDGGWEEDVELAYSVSRDRER